ncbi:MAG: efflux transporter outer rane subunit [Gammaproteobacteria bacterium]|nr:efflux transporter outer rane subunit [Gammaproteobacteria bacterium]
MSRCRIANAFIAMLGVLSGCTVGPDYHPPAPAAGAEAPLVSVTPALESVAEPPDDWWHLYHDLLLDKLLDEAFTANADLRVAAANLSAARAVLEATRVGRLPQTSVGVSAQYGRDAVTDEILEILGQPPQNVWIYDALLDVSYEVDLVGRVRRSIEAARADAASVAATRDSVKISVAAETARAYAQICALGEELSVARHSLEVVSREAEITVNRNEAGAGSQFDVVRAQGLVAQVRASIPPLEGQRRAVLFQLTALLGRTPSNAPTEAEGCMLPPRLKELIPVGDGATLLKRRPDVRQADRRMAAATARIGVATADLYPKVTLKGLFGGVSTQLNELATNKGLAWGLGPGISWTFPNEAGPRARVRQAKASAAAALAGFDSVVLQALKETEQALVSYGAELDRRQALSDAQDRAHKAFDMAHDQFIAGALSNLDLLSSEQSLIATDAAVATSDAALVQDQIAVFKALGGGWRVAETAGR